jgi:hypothetical protein
MKTLLIILVTIGALTAAILASGFALDPTVLLSIGFASGAVGMCVHTYSRHEPSSR